jgi:tRNA-2-methylthio-N6-dimethylallyladenosine synthase
MEINILNSSKENVQDAESLKQLEYIDKVKEKVDTLSAELGRKLTACVVTFGCQMNARDSEKLLAILKLAGYEETESEDADFVIYNTCTVRDNADQRVLGRLGQCSAFKKKNPNMKIAICGCMMQEQSAVEKIQKSYRFVDLIFGTHNIYKFAELLNTTLDSDRMIIDIWKETDKIVEDLPVMRKYPFKSGVNIMFGCNNFCTYCIVPYVRGRERSRSPRDIIRECEKLAADGVKEVMLLGQNVNSYGLDFKDDDPNKISFAKLLEMVCEVEGIERVRFMTPHPKDFSDELLDVIASNPKIARHIHLPLQAGNNEILRRMNRKYTREAYLELVDKIRTRLPEVAITTDIIVGFPGEDRAAVEETIDVVKKAHFDNAFTFIYSKRTGTPAASFEDQVPEDVVKENFDALLKVVQDSAKDQASKLQGRVENVLVEGVNEHDSSLLTGRMSNNTLVHFPGDESLIGQFAEVSLDECHGFYYLGKLVND